MNMLFQGDLNCTPNHVDNSIIIFYGVSNDLTMSFCSGDTLAVCGTNEVVGVINNGPNNTVYDLGQQNSLSFGGPPTTQTPMSLPPLTVQDFQFDRTGKVIVEIGQTAKVTSDNHGGSWLAVSGPGAALAHFIADPVANLTAHIQNNNA